MAKTIVKLFRDPKIAEKAIGDLIKHGFLATEIGTISQKGKADYLHLLFKETAREHTSLPETGDVVATGPLAAVVRQADPGAALIETLNITPEAYDYYRFGILSGGILISVHDSEQRLKKAASVLRSAIPKPIMMETGAKSPGFATADRMNATNPIDAPLSGDFRKY